MSRGVIEVQVRPLEPNDLELYDQLAARHGTVFNTREWLEIFGSKVQLFGLYDGGDNLIGGFHLYKQRKFGLSIYRNPPFTPLIGPFLEVRATKHVYRMSTWKEALSSIASFIEQLPYAVISFSLDKKILDTQPFYWHKFKVIPGYTYLLNLSTDEEGLKKNMSSSLRGDLRKGQKDGLRVEKSNDFNQIQSLVMKKFSRQDMKTSGYLGRVLFQFANQSNSFAFTTYQNGQPSATAFCIHDDHTAYYLLGGYDHENKHHGAGPLAVWNSIQYAKSLGLESFDFEGSMVPQIEQFFRGFGGELTPYYRVNKAKLPLEILLKFTKRELF